MNKDRIVQLTISISSSLKLRTRFICQAISITLFILLLVFLANTSYGQEVGSDSTLLKSSEKIKPLLKKNGIYITAATLGSAYNFINISYERMIWGNKDPKLQSLFVRASLGTFSGETVGFIIITRNRFSARTYLLTLGGLVGKKSSFFEISAGCMHASTKNTITSYWTDTYTYYTEETSLAFTIGYRYQAPGDNFIFRIGFGFYEIYYISLGFCF